MEPKQITMAEIRSWHPCYDPSRHLPEDWSGTALDMLRQGQIPPHDRLWAVLRQQVLDDRMLRLLACAYVRRTPVGDGRMVWDLLTDARSRAAVEAAERYALGGATEEELAAAASAASAAWAEEWAAAEWAVAAAGAARVAAAGAARAAAAGAARAEEWAAAEWAVVAAWAEAAAKAREWAREAAASAAASAAWEAQVAITIEVLEREGECNSTTMTTATS
jgi:hypothetical protein